MKGIQEFTIPKDKAEKAWKEHLKLLKTKKDEGLEILKSAYYHASKGHKIIDIYQAMQSAGLNKDGWPNLAICRGATPECCFERRKKGAGTFHHEDLSSWNIASNRSSVSLPEGTFMDLTVKQYPNRNENYRYAVVPTVPAQHYPKGNLDKYFLLWEVETWYEKSQIPVPPIDPFLLKRLSPNLFAVLAEWDLTPLERAVIRGALSL